MTTLRIENLGPIVDSSTINITPFMLVMGPQSTGKSTFMKVLCFCRWIEKRIMLYPSNMYDYTHYYRFLKELKQFHRLSDEFFSKDTKISYEGDLLSISYQGTTGNAKIKKKSSFNEERYNTKITYIPAERNLIAAIRNVDRAYRSFERDALFNLIFEWDEARGPITKENPFSLSVTGGFSYYNKEGADIILMPDGRPIPAFYASSGIQSVMPLEIMSRYVFSQVGRRSSFSKFDMNNYVFEVLDTDKSNSDKTILFSDLFPVVYGKDNLEIKTDEQPQLDKVHNDLIKTLLSKLKETSSKRVNYQSAQVYIEEPEQNLFPESQRLLLLSIVRSLKVAMETGSRSSCLFLTTHSPYILSVVNVLFRAAYAREKTKLGGVLDDDLILPSDSYSVYFIKDGRFENVLDKDVPMFSGNELDGVSDWVEDKISDINDFLYS